MSDLQAIFLDRDGTLIEDVGYLSDIEDVHLFPDTVASLQKLQTKFTLFVLTNQSGIASGHLSLEEVTRVNGHLDQILRAEGINITEWYVCPHSREDQCECMKPGPDFLHLAESVHGVNLKKSYVIGDHPHDALTGKELGVFGLYLLTGHGFRHLSQLPPDSLVFHRLGDAAQWVMDHPEGVHMLARRIEKGARTIRDGGTVAFPTETVYGLGADTFNPAAIGKVFDIKKRPRSNPLIVHVGSIDQVSLVAEHVPDNARLLMETFWPGPLTVVLPKRPGVPDIVTASNPTVAVRMPSNPVALSLIRLSGTPIAAPSANAFGCTSPTTAAHVRDQLNEQYDLLIDGGACRIGVESTVISFTGSSPVLLRPGGISEAEIELVIGPLTSGSDSPSLNLESPGLLKSHYAPQTPMKVFFEIPDELLYSRDVGLLLNKTPSVSVAGPFEILSPVQDTKEIALNLYAAIRRLDSLGLRLIADRVGTG